jgi:flagella basal body P-ring formation protein FlgA
VRPAAESAGERQPRARGAPGSGKDSPPSRRHCRVGTLTRADARGVGAPSPHRAARGARTAIRRAISGLHAGAARGTKRAASRGVSSSLYRIAACALVASAVWPSAARAAAAIVDPASLVAVARATAAEHTGRTAPGDLDVRPPDPRLRLPACPTPLRGSVAPGTRSATRLTVEIGCAEPAWRHYVQVLVRVHDDVVVAARPIPRGQPIESADLEVVRRDVGTLTGGHFRASEAVVGRAAQRPIGAGEVVLPAVAKSPTVVRRGQQVTLLARAAGVQVRVDAVALADGGVADRVRVRNVATGRQVQGVVRSADTVEVVLE